MSSLNLSTDAATLRGTGPHGLKPLMGRSRAIEDLSLAVEQIAKTDYTVVIQGETGTGKEIVAQQIHRRSTKKASPFLGVDCGAIPGHLFESELFGHEKGAFTGADSKVQGLLAVAKGGTLLLDEITGLTPEMQRKFLRVLEEKAFLPVGGKKSVPVEGRILVASNVNLDEEVEKENFRADLYHRLSEFIIKVPELRGHCEAEKSLAVKAKTFLEETLNKGQMVELRQVQRGKYFRLVAEVRYGLTEYLLAVTIESGACSPLLWGAEAKRVVPVSGPLSKDSELLDKLVQKVGKKGESARVLGVSPSTFEQVV